MKKIWNKIKSSSKMQVIIPIAIGAFFIITGSIFGFDCPGYYECLNWYGWIALIVSTGIVVLGFFAFGIVGIINWIRSIRK